MVTSDTETIMDAPNTGEEAQTHVETEQAPVPEQAEQAAQETQVAQSAPPQREPRAESTGSTNDISMKALLEAAEPQQRKVETR